MSRRASHTRGFSLVELLVVIAIIGLLVALVLPAVQGAREAARRTQCTNNLRQVALAAIARESHLGRFPSACLFDPVATGTGADGYGVQAWGWGAMILPWLEQKAIHDALQPDSRPLNDVVKDAAAVQLMRTPLPTFRCPSDDGSEINDQIGFKGVDSGGPPYLARSNVVAVYGRRILVTTSPGDGIFFRNSEMSMANVRDGASNTFLLGERATTVPGGPKTYAASVYGVALNNIPAGAYRGILYVAGSANTPLNSTYPGDYTFYNFPSLGFSSRHPGIAHFAFADGSTRAISEHIDYPTYQMLAGRNDGIPAAGF